MTPILERIYEIDRRIILLSWGSDCGVMFWRICELIYRFLGFLISQLNFCLFEA